MKTLLGYKGIYAMHNNGGEIRRIQDWISSGVAPEHLSEVYLNSNYDLDAAQGELPSYQSGHWTPNQCRHDIETSRRRIVYFMTMADDIIRNCYLSAGTLFAQRSTAHSRRHANTASAIRNSVAFYDDAQRYIRLAHRLREESVKRKLKKKAKIDILPLQGHA